MTTAGRPDARPAAQPLRILRCADAHRSSRAGPHRIQRLARSVHTPPRRPPAQGSAGRSSAYSRSAPAQIAYARRRDPAPAASTSRPAIVAKRPGATAPPDSSPAALPPGRKPATPQPSPVGGATPSRTPRAAGLRRIKHHTAPEGGRAQRAPGTCPIIHGSGGDPSGSRGFGVRMENPTEMDNRSTVPAVDRFFIVRLFIENCPSHQERQGREGGEEIARQLRRRPGRRRAKSPVPRHRHATASAPRPSAAPRPGSRSPPEAPTEESRSTGRSPTSEDRKIEPERPGVAGDHAGELGTVVLDDEPSTKAHPLAARTKAYHGAAMARKSAGPCHGTSGAGPSRASGGRPRDPPAP